MYFPFKREVYTPRSRTIKCIFNHSLSKYTFLHPPPVHQVEKKFKRPPQFADQLLFPGRRLDKRQASTYSGYSGRSLDIETIVSGGRADTKGSQRPGTTSTVGHGSLPSAGFTRSLNDVREQPWESFRQHIPSANSQLGQLRRGSVNHGSGSRVNTAGTTGNLNYIAETADHGSKGGHGHQGGQFKQHGHRRSNSNPQGLQGIHGSHIRRNEGSGNISNQSKGMKGRSMLHSFPGASESMGNLSTIDKQPSTHQSSMSSTITAGVPVSSRRWNSTRDLSSRKHEQHSVDRLADRLGDTQVLQEKNEVRDLCSPDSSYSSDTMSDTEYEPNPSFRLDLTGALQRYSDEAEQTTTMRRHTLDTSKLTGTHRQVIDIEKAPSEASSDRSRSRRPRYLKSNRKQPASKTPQLDKILWSLGNVAY